MKAEIDLSRGLKNTTMRFRVKGVRRFLLRVKLGLLFMRLGAWIMGLGVFEVEIADSHS